MNSSVALDSLPIHRLRRSFARLLRTLRPWPKPTVVVWHRFFAPPWGGGNQFLLALSGALRTLGVDVAENECLECADAHLVNAATFDVARFREFAKDVRPGRIVHRLNGPISHYRGSDDQYDRVCRELNERFADASIVQSEYTLKGLRDIGFDPANPVVVRNAVDPSIFHRQGRIPFDRDRKTRIVSTSWSSNARKGGPIYRWLDEHLDRQRFDYTFVGNCSEPLPHARRIAPLRPRALAHVLRQHDLYVIASAFDPCSNALIEALACGLPVLYLDSGGHPELVNGAGLGFESADEIPQMLDALVENYDRFQGRIRVNSLSNVAETYLRILVGRPVHIGSSS